MVKKVNYYYDDDSKSFVPKTKLQRNFIALGNGATMALGYIHKRGIKGNFVYINDEEKNNFTEDVSFIPYKVPFDYSDTHKLKKFRLRIPEKISSIFLVNQPYTIKRFYIFVALGGVNGSMLAQKLYLLLIKNKIDFIIIGSYPFSFEGAERKKFAKKITEKFNQDNFTYFHGDDIGYIYWNMNLKKSLKKLDHHFYITLKRIISNEDK